MCFQDNKLRAFGAGLMSSASELEVSKILYSSTKLSLFLGLNLLTSLLCIFMVKTLEL